VNNTTTIWMPEKWDTLEITNGGGISRNLALNSEIVSAANSAGNIVSNINDKDYTNYWTLPASNPEFEVVLDKVEEISEIQLTWGFNYANAYTVEVSKDGYNYTEVANVTEGVGDEEVVKLDKTYEAQYIRFSGFQKAQKALSQLTDVRIYGSSMDYVGVCDITGNISVEQTTEEENFTDFEEDLNTDDSTSFDDDFVEETVSSSDETTEEDTSSESSWQKKVIRRKFIPGGLDWWVILIIVVVSVAVLASAGITIFIIIRKKKSKNKKLQ